MSGLADAMREGGLFMWPILFCGVLGASIAVERTIHLFFRAGIDSAAFLAQVQRAVLDGNIDQAVSLCNMEPNAALPRVLKAGLVRATRPEGELRAAIEEEQLEVLPLLNRRTAYLPTTAGVAILLGVLGTVQGLIDSFQALGQAPVDVRSTALAGGIAVAMYTTYFGLLVAIPLLASHGVLVARTTALRAEIEHGVVKLVNLLNACRQRAGLHGGGAPILPFPS